VSIVIDSTNGVRPKEYRVYSQNEPYVPPMGFERLQNEAACLEFVRSNTAKTPAFMSRTISASQKTLASKPYGLSAPDTTRRGLKGQKVVC
jgi:hypothetical protein